MSDKFEISAAVRAQVAAESDDPQRTDALALMARKGGQYLYRRPMRNPPKQEGALALVDWGADVRSAAFWRGGVWVDEWGAALTPQPTHWAQFANQPKAGK